MKKVCHLSSAHHGLDVRIFEKECVSLAAGGYNTHLVITATAQDVERAAAKGVSIYKLPPPSGRFSRMLKQAWCCYRIAKELDADIYHFHDPELIPCGILISLAGKQVIYDVHEDLPKDILTKNWIPLCARKLVAAAAGSIEYLGARYFFSVVTATPFIAERFRRINPRTVDINNYPLLGELENVLPWGAKQQEVCYVGGIDAIRGIKEVIVALELVKTSVSLNLAGQFSEAEVEAEVKVSRGWQRVNELGFLNREGVRDVLGRSVAGLVTLHPVINYIDALPVKMFEYMSSSIPVIASNFPLWRDIIEGNDCGLCVDPMKPQAIAEAIDFLMNNPGRAQQMGENGRKAVEEKYNWGMEEHKLFALYANLIKPRP